MTGTIGRKDLGHTAMKALLAFSLVLLTTGCTANPTPNLTPLAPYSVVADTLVWLEDACEDPLEDAQTLTPLEAVADMFALPMTMAVYTARLATYFTVGTWCWPGRERFPSFSAYNVPGVSVPNRVQVKSAEVWETVFGWVSRRSEGTR